MVVVEKSLLFCKSFTYSNEEPYNTNKQESGKSLNSYASNEIKLHLEDEINGVDQSRLSECCEECNVVVKGIQIDTKQNYCEYDVEVKDNIKQDFKETGEVIHHNHGIGLDAYTKS
ncbi:hypothetical protein V8G54_037696, partial [Vigna mungo]